MRGVSTALVLAPTVAIALCTALWNVSQRFFNDRYHINVWGYVSLDQVLAPIYVLPFLALTDAVGCARAILLSRDDQSQSFWEACIASWHEQGGGRLNGEAVKVGVGVLLSNVRVFVYFHLLITYNMSQTFFMLTMLRVVSSWGFVIAMAKLAPDLVDLQPEQRTKMFMRDVVTLKLSGSCLILVALATMIYL